MTIGSRRPHRTASPWPTGTTLTEPGGCGAPQAAELSRWNKVGPVSWPSQWDACRGILVCEPFVRLHAGWVTLQGASRAPSDCTAGVEESAGGGCLKVASTNDRISSGQTSWIHLWREPGAVNFTVSLLGHTGGHTVTKLPISVSR